MVEHDTVFTNVAKTDDGDVWWEGLTDDPPAHLVDWNGKDWTPASDKPAAHPNSRFTTAAEQAPSIAAEWEDPKGVPIDAMLFGGRRSTTVPLIVESLDWRHGVLLGACMGSETTAAIVGKVGKLRRDPFAMLAFCGYHMADYFEHWLEIGRREGAKLPKLYNVNWFRKDLESGEYLWPGFGDNSRVLKWVFERCDGGAEAVETPIGLLPTEDALDLDRRRRQRGADARGAEGRPRRVARGDPAHPRVLRRVRRQAPGGAADRAGRARGPDRARVAAAPGAVRTRG